MIKFDKKSREKFVEYATREILRDVEAVVHDKLEVVANAVEEAIIASGCGKRTPDVEDSPATAGECSEEFACGDCPISDSCPIADIGGEAEDEEGGEDDQPTIEINTKNLNPAQEAAIKRFLEEFAADMRKTPKKK